MKKLLLYAFAAIVGLASCAKDPVSHDGARKKGEPVMYSLSVGGFGYDKNDESRYNDLTGGALANVDPEQFLIRYVLEVYNSDGTELVNRYERFVDFTKEQPEEGEVVMTTESQGATKFFIRLLTDKYKFALWADLVPREGIEPTSTDKNYIDEPVELPSASDYFYDTSDGLDNVAVDMDLYDVKDDAFINGGRRMSRDAYCSTASVDLVNDRVTDGSLNLKRAFGRVMVYGQKMDPDRLQAAGITVPDSVVVTYADNKYYSKYDVLTAKPFGDPVMGEVSYGHSLTPEDHPVEAEVVLGNKTYTDLQLITFDYLLPTSDDTDKTSFTIKYFADGVEIPDITSEVLDKTIVSNKQQRFVVNLFGNDHQYIAVLKDADGTVIPGGLTDPDTALEEALDRVPDGGTIKLYAGAFKSTGLNIDFKNVTIEGIGEQTIIYGENPIDQPNETGSYYGKNPILKITGAEGDANTANVTIKDVTFTIRNTPGPGDADGLTISGFAAVTLDGVVFDGIGNMVNGAYTPNDNQQGRAITVLSGAKLTATNCSFSHFNKNAVDVFAGGRADMSNCTVVGDAYDAQNVYDRTSGDQETKVNAAYAGHAIQNGFVFREGAAGSVTECQFSDLKFGLERLLRKEKWDQSRAVYIVDASVSSSVTGDSDPTNTYTNCELDWNVWVPIPDSDNAKLVDLALNGVTVDNFSPDQLVYDITVDNNVETAVVTAVKEHEYAKVAINPAEITPLPVGVMVPFEVTVTAENGDQLVYKVNVTRVASDDASLSTITVNGAAVEGFSPEKLAYSVEVENDVTSVEVLAEQQHGGATAVIEPAGVVEIASGEMKEFTITVTAQDGTTQLIYTVNVTRKKSDNAKLVGISINGTSIADFSESTFVYDVTVADDVETAQVTEVLTAHGEATFSIDPDGAMPLEPGIEQTFTIVVTAENGEQLTYTVNVTRHKLSDNAKLTSIQLNGVTIEGFSADKLEYEVTHAIGDNISLTALAEHENANVVIEPNPEFSLADGEEKEFVITVTAEDSQATLQYRIKVTGFVE